MDKYKIIRYNFLGFLLYTLFFALLIINGNGIEAWLILWGVQMAGNLIAGLVSLFQKKNRPKAKYYFFSALMVLMLVPLICAGFIQITGLGLIH